MVLGLAAVAAIQAIALAYIALLAAKERAADKRLTEAARVRSQRDARALEKSNVKRDGGDK